MCLGIRVCVSMSVRFLKYFMLTELHSACDILQCETIDVVRNILNEYVNVMVKYILVDYPYS